MAEEIKEEEKEVKKEETKKEEKKKIDIKELFNKNKKLAIGILGGVVALIVIIIVVVSLSSNNDEKEPNKGNNGGNGSSEEEQYPDDAIFSDEETIKNEYGFSKEDAINVIKAFYHSDNYKFEAKARKDNMYEVTVTNTETNTADVYEVDPNDGSFVYITNISEE